MNTCRILGAAFAALLVGGCAAAPSANHTDAVPDTPPNGDRADTTAGADDLPPAGYGTLRQDAVTVPLRVGPLLIKVTPLDESITRLLAPDSYQRLNAVAESRRAEARDAVFGGQPEMFQVSFFSYEPDVRFQPQDLTLMYQGQVLRPAIILPITPGWGRERLQQREMQSAVYVFDGGIDYDLPLTVRYGMEQTDHWRRVIPTLERERAAVRARAP